MNTEMHSDWRSVLGSIARDAGTEADLPGKMASGFDGDAYIWSWSSYVERSSVIEVVLRGYPDSLETGVNAQVLGSARRIASRLIWSAIVWTRHIGSRQPVRGELDLRSEDLEEFREELPHRLREAFAKAQSVAPELEALAERQRKSNHRFAEQYRRLFLD